MGSMFIGTRCGGGHFKLSGLIDNKVPLKAFRENNDIMKTVFKRIDLTVVHKDYREKEICDRKTDFCFYFYFFE